jgi:hypothetical protein
MAYVRWYRVLGYGYFMRILRVARRTVADGDVRSSSDLGDEGDCSEHQERGTHRPRPQQRVSGLNAHVRVPFLAMEV